MAGLVVVARRVSASIGKGFDFSFTLEMRRRPAQMLVIDSLSEKPSEN